MLRSPHPAASAAANEPKRPAREGLPPRAAPSLLESVKSKQSTALPFSLNSPKQESLFVFQN
jgi:hypothetical protein